MPEGDEGRLRHLIIDGYSDTAKYARPRLIIEQAHIPEQDRARHGAHLRGQIDSISADMLSAIEIQKRAGLEEDRGIKIEFESFPGIKDAFDTLTFNRSGIELLNVRNNGDRNTSFATVFVPDGKLDYFIRQIDSYLLRKKKSDGTANDHQKQIDTIKSIQAAGLRALWTDDAALFPGESDSPFWWEAWISHRADKEKSEKEFRAMAAWSRLRTSTRTVVFPERSVILVYADFRQMREAMSVMNTLAELRRAKDTAEFFVELSPHEEGPWVEDLLARTDYAGSEDEVPRVCILDTGINRAHPLLERSLDSDDMFSINPDWGTADRDGHGTNMAGLALFGDLTGPMSSEERIFLGHRLESSKLLPTGGANSGDDHLHADLTMQAVARPEIGAPRRKRLFELAVSADDYRDQGRPSAWSATIDQLAADSENGAENPRLFVVAAGNIGNLGDWVRYPVSNDEEGIHDPGQAWNALTVGAYTDMVDIRDDGADDYRPIAPAGDLSPFSTTSANWEKDWPLKPDVVMEGGNAARDAYSPVCLSSLSLLTTHYVPSERLLTTANATSAATALASRLAARIMAVYPNLRPETLRGLIVHSAEWTDAMNKRFGISAKCPKGNYEKMVRRCGFGVPDVDRALWSLSNSLTMIVEDSIQPFIKEESKSNPRMNEMRLYDLPWPEEALRDLAQTEVEMRVTLSYFIEPNPSSRGRSKYVYESHGLRFDVIRPEETKEHFKARVSDEFRDDQYRKDSYTSSPWLLGKDARHRGSVHSDIWRGLAADLAKAKHIAVYPTSGWWAKRIKLGKYSSIARYSLIVSICAPQVDVDLYTPVETMTRTKIEIN
jgi:hypothetical protein